MSLPPRELRAETGSARRQTAWISLGVLASLVVAFLFEGLFLDRALLGLDNRLLPPFCVLRDPAEPVTVNLITSDINGFILPETIAQRRAWRVGRVPLWNPWQNLGQPLLADIGFAPFYPTAPLELLAEPLRGYAWSMALHLLWLSLGTVVFLRRRGLGAAAALFGAVVVTFSGFSTVHLHLPHFLRVMAWFPWLAVAAERLAQAPSSRRTAVAALVVAAMLLAGFPQLALWGLVGGSVVFVVALVERRRPGCVPPSTTPAASSTEAPTERRRFDLVRACCGWAAALGLGAAVSAVQLAPTAQVLSESLRPTHLDASSYQRSSLGAPALLGALSPRFLSWPVQEIHSLEDAKRVEEWPPHHAWLSDDDQDNAVENTLWVGLAPLFLACSALVRRKRSLEWLGLIAVLGALAVAMAAPGISGVVRAIPGIGAGSPKRALVFTAVGLCILAASALDRSLRERRRSTFVVAAAAAFALAAFSFLPFESRWFSASPADRLDDFRRVFRRDVLGFVAAGSALALAALSVKRRPAAAAAVVIGATGGELVLFGRDFNPPQTRTDQYQATAAVEWLSSSADVELYRVLPLQADFLLGGNFGQVFEFQAVNGVSAMLDRRVGELLAMLDPGMVDLANPRFTHGLQDPAALRSPLLDLLGVRHLAVSVSGNTLLEQHGAQLGVERVYASEPEQIAFWQRPTALPRAFLVPSWEVVADRDQRLQRLASASFEPSQRAFVEEPVPDLPATGLAVAPVHLRRPRPERVELDLEVAGPVLLLFTEAWSPGWSVTVDGVERPLLRADHAFQAVALPAGARSVVFEYRSRPFELGAACAAGGMLGIAWLGLRRRRRGRGERAGRMIEASSRKTGSRDRGAMELGGRS